MKNLFCHKETASISLIHNIGTPQKKQRESGVELLRILAACMVIWLHTNLPWGYTVSCDGINKVIQHIIEAIAVPAVDIFILITGYFMYNKKELGIGKPISLLIQLLIFKAFFFLLGYIYKYPDLPFGIDFLLPNNYFVTLYIALYFFSPYINKILDGLTDKQGFSLLIIGTVLFSINPVLWDYIHLYTSLDTAGLSSVSRWHNDTGQNFTTFLFVYLVGAFLNKTQFDKRISRKTALLVWSISTVALLTFYYVDERFTDDFFGCVTLFYHNPLVIIQAASLFLLFKKTAFRSKIINKLAAAAFTCFMLQGKLIGVFRNEYYLQGGPISLVLFYVLLAVVIYLISYIVFFIYDLCTKWFISRLERIKITYYD